MTITEKQKQIAQEYKEFWSTATKLADEDVTRYPLQGKGVGKRRMISWHIENMIKLFEIRYGDPDQRLQIMEWLERQLFRALPIEDEVCHLTLDMWKDLKKTIVAGEYRDLSENKPNVQ